nr:hypothetical protein [Vibrio owensii]
MLGTKLGRVELTRLIDDSHQEGVLLIEKRVRLSRLPFEQWKPLKQKLLEAGIHIIELRQPMSTPFSIIQVNKRPCFH